MSTNVLVVLVNMWNSWREILHGIKKFNFVWDFGYDSTRYSDIMVLVSEKQRKYKNSLPTIFEFVSEEFSLANKKWGHL